MENDIRPPYLKRAILAFVIATIIFIAGFLTSYLVSYSKYQSVSTSQEQMRYSLLSIELEKQLAVDSCDIFNPYNFAEELDNMGKTLTLLEERFGKWDKKVIEQKKIYVMLELQHFLLIKQHNEKCNDSIQTILFFYSNEEDFIKQAEKIGFVLASVKKDHEVMIYSFDFGIDSNIIKILKGKYQVTKPNTIIIGEKIPIEGLDNISELAKYLL